MNVNKRKVCLSQWAGVVVGIFTLAGCGGQSDSDDTSGVNTPVPESILALKALNPAAQSLDITLLIDPGTRQAQKRTVRTITFDESAVPVEETLDGIALGPHQFQIEYRVKFSGSPSTEAGLVVAVSTILNGEVKTGGQPLSLVFKESGLDLSPDDDNDGFSNLAELRAGTDPIDRGAKPPVNTPPPVAAAAITAQNAVEITSETYYVMETVIFGSLGPLWILENTKTGPCDISGSVDVTAEGDSVTVVAHQCRFINPDNSNGSTDGTLVITRLAETSDPVAGTKSSFRIRYERYIWDDGTRVRTLNGVTTLARATSSSSEYASIRVAVFTFTEGTTNFAVPSLTVEVVTDKTAKSTTERFLGSVHTTRGRVDIDTVDPLISQGEADPSSGQLEIFTTTSGLALFPRTDGVTVDVAIDTNGDALVDETLVKTWRELGW